jgi:hypothetical protein
MKTFQLCLIRRKNRLHKRFLIFDIVIVKINVTHKPVIEKIGSWDLTGNKLVINIFRLIFWICYDISVSYLAFKMLTEFYFFDLLANNEIFK